MELRNALFKLKPKNKKNPPRKKFLVFSEIKLSSNNITKSIIFSQKKAFLIFWERKTSKKLFIFQETERSYISKELSKPPKQKLLIFLKKKLRNKFSKDTLG